MQQDFATALELLAEVPPFEPAAALATAPALFSKSPLLEAQCAAALEFLGDGPAIETDEGDDNSRPGVAEGALEEDWATALECLAAAPVFEAGMATALCLVAEVAGLDTSFAAALEVPARAPGVEALVAPAV